MVFPRKKTRPSMLAKKEKNDKKQCRDIQILCIYSPSFFHCPIIPRGCDHLFTCSFYIVRYIGTNHFTTERNMCFDGMWSEECVMLLCFILNLSHLRLVRKITKISKIKPHNILYDFYIISCV